MKLYAFEKLDCWQKARELSKFVYLITSKFPSEEKFGLVSQIRRCATSVAANIAEGSSRSTAKDQAHFSTIAYSSTIELLNHLIIANDLEILNEDEYLAGRERIEKLTYQINVLRKSQIDRIK